MAWDQEWLFRSDLVCLEQRLPEAELLSRGVSESKKGWDRKSPFFQELPLKGGHGMAHQSPADWATDAGSAC